jgi:hypothetical protein
MINDDEDSRLKRSKNAAAMKESKEALVKRIMSKEWLLKHPPKSSADLNARRKRTVKIEVDHTLPAKQSCFGYM